MLNGRFKFDPVRFLIIISAGLVLAYSISVLVVVITMPEVGVYSSFRNTVTRINPDYLAAENKADFQRFVDWRIVHFGDEAIHSWPQWLRAITEAGGEPADQGRPGWRTDEAGQTWVRVELTNGDDVAAVWCRVGRIAPDALLPSILWIILETALFFIAAMVFWNRPFDPGARMFYLLSIVVIGAYMGGYHWSRIAIQPVLTGIYIICSVLLPAVNLHFFLQFPTARPVLKRYPGRSLAVVYGIPVLFMGYLLVGYVVVRWLSRTGADAQHINDLLARLRQVIFGYFGVAAAWYVASVVAIAHAYRHARDSKDKNQIRWILTGSVLALVPIGYTLYLANRRPADFSGGAAIWPMFAASTCFTFAYAIGITRYRMWKLDQMLNSGLAYFVVSGLAAVIYCALVVIGMLLFGTAGPSLEQAALVGGSALVLTIGMDMARARLRNYLDRRYRKDKTQLDEILQKFGEAVEQLVDLPTLASRLLQVSLDLSGFRAGAVYIRGSHADVLTRAGTVGGDGFPTTMDTSAPLLMLALERPIIDRLNLPPMNVARLELVRSRGDVAVALTHEHQLIGLLILSRGAGQPGRIDDVRPLASFAPIAALALAGAEVRQAVGTLNQELQAKVEKISEQQRRIFSLQQQLVAQSRRFPAPAADAAPQPGTVKPEQAFSTIVGSSPALQHVLDLVPRVSANNSAVLIRGESGTGKELLARAIHDLSPRSDGPFVKVHCAALAPGILESELFGHVKGAFTGALRDKAGRFELVDGGTLFLDEIGDISLEVQTKLLRVLQEKTFERVGSNELIRVDVRLVTATHQDLDKLIRTGRFRADLYYRLNVIALHMPPLRERGEDIIELAHHFLRVHSERCRKNVDSIDDDALLALRDYPWPGNIRELENVIERAVVIIDGPTVTLNELPAELFRNPIPSPTPEATLVGTPFGSAVQQARRMRHAQEKAELVRVLEQAGGNRTEAARRLGLARSTLISRMKKYGLSDGLAE